MHDKLELLSASKYLTEMKSVQLIYSMYRIAVEHGGGVEGDYRLHFHLIAALR